MVRQAFNKRDCTCTSIESTTSSTSYEDITITRIEEYTTVIITYTKNSNEEHQKIKELLRKDAILKMKEKWNNLKNEFKPIPLIRPNIQLRGVCYGGRGWA